jgi:transcriptional regulator with XRE-family HTH domain
VSESCSEVLSKAELGAYLSDARQSRGFKLDDVAATTRISKNYLLAIEAGDFEKLPNAAYVKGFLRLYAGFVGLSGDQVVAMYERTGDRLEEPEGESQPAPAKYSAKPAGRRRFIMPLVLLVLVLIAAVVVQKNDGKKPVIPVPAPQAKPAAPVVAPVPVQPVISSARPNAATLSFAPPVPATEPAPPASESGAKGVFLKLKCNQDSTLNITIDDNLSQHYELKAGDLIEWKAENSITLDLGNAGGVEAEFNGKLLKPFGAAGASAHVVLRPDSSR